MLSPESPSIKMTIVSVLVCNHAAPYPNSTKLVKFIIFPIEKHNERNYLLSFGTDQAVERCSPSKQACHSIFVICNTIGRWSLTPPKYLGPE